MTTASRQSGARGQRRSAGFTLIELMLALVAGSFVIAGAYYLSDVSARLFNEQVRRAETQMTLRSAGEQLRRDIGRAGFMAMRDSEELWGCNALKVVNGGSEVTPVRQRGVRVSQLADQRIQLFLTGNFTTSDQYPLDPASNANTLVLASAREGFRRSFTDPADGTTFLPQRFLSAFVPDPAAPNTPQGRMVSIQDLSTGRVFLRDIMAVNPLPPNAPQITINPPLPTVGGCIPSFSTLVVAPISTVRYMLENPTANPELSRAAGPSMLTGGGTLVGGAQRLVLTRREIDMRTNIAADPTPIPLTTRIVLDFVSSANVATAFRIQGSFDDAMRLDAVVPAAPTLRWSTTPHMPPFESTSLRSLLVELVASTAEGLAAGAPANDEKASRIQAGRRLLRLEVEMPNMARNSGTL